MMIDTSLYPAVLHKRSRRCEKCNVLIAFRQTVNGKNVCLEAVYWDGQGVHPPELYWVDDDDRIAHRLSPGDAAFDRPLFKCHTEVHPEMAKGA